MTRECVFCHLGDQDSRGLGRLLGPVEDSSSKSSSSKSYLFHHLCALWSPQVCETADGALLNLRREIRRGRSLRCARCANRGATLGCRVPSCPRSYHVACAQQDGATFFPASFQMACQAHAPMFSAEEGTKCLVQTMAVTADAGAEEGAGACHDLSDSHPKPSVLTESNRKRLLLDATTCVPQNEVTSTKARRSLDVYCCELERPSRSHKFSDIVATDEEKSDVLQRFLVPMVHCRTPFTAELRPPRKLLLHGENTADKMAAVRSLIGEVAAVLQSDITAFIVPSLKRADSIRQSEAPGMAALGLTRLTRRGFSGSSPLDPKTCSFSTDRGGPIFVVVEVDQGDDDGTQRLTEFLDTLLPPLRQSMGLILLMDGVLADVPCALRRHIDCQMEILPNSRQLSLLSGYWRLPRQKLPLWRKHRASTLEPCFLRMLGEALLQDVRLATGYRPRKVRKLPPRCLATSLLQLAIHLVDYRDCYTIEKVVGMVQEMRRVEKENTRETESQLQRHRFAAFCELLDDVEWACRDED